MSSRAKKILVVAPSGVGDSVLAQSLFITLKQQRPDRQIDVLAADSLMPLFERMPEVDRRISSIIDFDRLELDKRYRLSQGLKKEEYDQAIVLPDSLTSALVPFFAEIPERTGWRGSMRYFLLNDIRLFSKRRYPLRVQRFVALAHEPGAQLPDLEGLPRPALHVDKKRSRDLCEQYGFERDRPILALCPQAELGPASGWPLHNYAELAGEYVARGWQVALFSLGSASPESQTIIGLLEVSARRHCVSLEGEAGLANTVDMLAAATAVVSNDSAIIHIAAALNRPIVVVYGPTSTAFAPALTDMVSAEWIEVACRPCQKEVCPLPRRKSPGKCLHDLPPGQVARALDGLLAQAGEIAGELH